MAPHSLRPPKRQAPQSEYTRRIAEGGMAEYEAARAERRAGVQGAQQNYADQGVFAYQQAPRQGGGDMYDQWLEALNVGAPSRDGQYAYGRTPEGSYAGFKNEGTLKAATRGRAENIRAEDRERFAALDAMASQNLDKVAADYDTALGEAAEFYRFDPNEITADQYRQYTQPALGAAKPARPPGMSPTSATPGDIPRRSGEVLAPGDRNSERAGSEFGSRLADGVLERMAADSDQQAQAIAASANRYTGMAKQEQQKGYQADKLNPWLADQGGRYLEAQEFAQQGLATPIDVYAQRAGAEYGIDPNIVAGWYPDASAIGDFRDQRDLGFLQETGMLPSDYEGALTDMERQAQEGEQGALTEQEQAIDQFGLQQTNGVIGTNELATAVNLEPLDVADLLSSPAFTDYTADIFSALQTEDADTVAATMTRVLDDAAYLDPALLNILQTVYKDYIPADYELLG